MHISEHAVVIAGGGPTGLMLAGELAFAGVDVAIVERRPSQISPARAQAGCTRAPSRFSISAASPIGSSRRARKSQTAGFAGVSSGHQRFPHPSSYGLGLWQNHIERILAGWVEELAVPIYRGIEVTGFAQDDTGVDVELQRWPVAARAISRWVRRRTQPGPQGGRHRVPGIGPDHQQSDRPGRVHRARRSWASTARPRHPLLRPRGVQDRRRQDRLRRSRAGRRAGDRTEVGATTDQRWSDLSEALIAACGTDYGVHSPT